MPAFGANDLAQMAANSNFEPPILQKYQFVFICMIASLSH